MACGLSGTLVGLSAASLWLGTPLLPSCQLVSLQHHFLLHLNILFFTRTPNQPQSQASFQWPAYSLDTKAYTNLDLVITSERDVFSQRMAFWLSLVPPVTTQLSSAATQNASHQSSIYSAAETASNAAGRASKADHTHLRTVIVVLYVLACTCWRGL